MTNPKHLQVELTNYCNLACIECPHHLMKRPLSHMSEEVFLKVLELIKLYNPDTVILHKDGEPLMCPMFKDYFKRIAEVSNKKIDLYTNGLLLTKDNVEFMSAHSGKNKIWILLSFHQFKHDGSRYDLSKVEETLLACVKMKLPNVEFVLAMHRLDQTDDREATEFYIKWTNISLQYRGTISAVHVNSCINHWAGRVKQNKEMAHFYTCPYMDGNHLFIGNSGDVVPCCMDMEEEIVFGNILKDDMYEVMKSREAFYAILNKREVGHPLCERCLE